MISPASALVLALLAPAAPAPAAATSLPAVRQQDDGERPFAERLSRFWTWFARDEERIHRRRFDPKVRASLAELISEEVGAFGRSVGWAFGPGDREGQAALCLIPEGDLGAMRVLTEVWAESAPELEHWVVRPSRPPIEPAGLQMGVGQRQIDLDGCRAWIDPGDGRATVRVHHAAFAELEGRAATLFVGTVVERVVGDDGFALWVEDVVAAGEAPEGEGLGLGGLRAALEAAATARGLRLERGLGARVPFEQAPDAMRSRALRADVRTGVTCVPRFIAEFQRRNGRPKDPLRGSGAHLACLRVPRADGVPGAAALEERLAPFLSLSRSLGHADGTEAVYVDLMLLDADAAADELTRILARFADVPGATLHPMARRGPDERTIK